jgi:hypothetical protein
MNLKRSENWSFPNTERPHGHAARAHGHAAQCRGTRTVRAPKINGRARPLG